MNKIQNRAIQLMRNDLRFLYTIVKNCEYTKETYYIALMPYMGIIIDGIEDWINSYNSSMKTKLDVPVFTDEEKRYYEIMRNSSKLFENGYKVAYETLGEKYKENVKYFSSVCKTMARTLRLYDIYGVYTMNGKFCDNTILDSYYLPFHTYDEDYGDKIKKLFEIGGMYIRLFGAMQPYNVKYDCVFDHKDFGGFIKSPVGNKYSIKFLLLCIYCQVNFITHCVNEFIEDEISSKLRFAYILYYYLLKVLPEINNEIKSNLRLDSKYDSVLFRNAMMHYKLGVALKEDELIENDCMYGLTQKYFNADYLIVKNEIMKELSNLSFQIKEYLKL